MSFCACRKNWIRWWFWCVCVCVCMRFLCFCISIQRIVFIVYKRDCPFKQLPLTVREYKIWLFQLMFRLRACHIFTYSSRPPAWRCIIKFNFQYRQQFGHKIDTQWKWINLNDLWKFENIIILLIFNGFDWIFFFVSIQYNRWQNRDNNKNKTYLISQHNLCSAFRFICGNIFPILSSKWNYIEQLKEICCWE